MPSDGTKIRHRILLLVKKKTSLPIIIYVYIFLLTKKKGDEKR